MLSAGICLIFLFFCATAAEAEDVEAEGEYSELVEELRSSPLDINSATAEEFRQLPGLSPSIAARITELRERIGGFRETVDLVRYKIISPELFDIIAPYLVTRRARTTPVDDIRLRIRETGRWSTGEDSQLPAGNYMRVLWKRGGKWTAGLVVGKDPGEVQMIDNWKWSILFRKKDGVLRSLAVGNIKYELSEGLLFFSRSRMSKGYLAPGSTGREGRGLRVDLSSTEGYLLRGAGLALSMPGGIVLTTLFSRAPLDVSRDDDGRVTTIRTSGLHLPGSTADRDGINLSTFAAHLQASRGMIESIGVTFVGLGYSEPVLPILREDNYYSFRGSQRCFLGFNWALARSGLGFFGESGVETGRGRGLLLGLEREMGSVRWSMLFRDYSSAFAPPYGNPFQDGSGAPENEQGLYAGMAVRLSPEARLSLFVDSYRRPWRSSRGSFPTRENEMFVEAEWRPEKGVQASLRYTSGSGEKAESEEGITKDRQNLTRRLRLQMEWKDEPMEFRGRYEIVISRHGEQPGERGSLLYFDTRFCPFATLTVDARMTAFGTETYSSAVYAYEVDLPGVMSIPAFSGTGLGWYVLGKYRPTKKVMLSAKFSERVRRVSGGGTDGDLVITMDRKLGLQFDYRY